MVDSDDRGDVEATDVTKREGHKSAKVARRDEPQSYLARGTLVGRYVILDVIGEGGMGVVYAAFDPELDRKVAIKLMQGKQGGGSSGGDQAWLVREAQALARLAHPNVVAVYDVGTLPGDRVFIAMELVSGETLRAWLKAKPRSWREVLRVMAPAGAGLAAAHAAGLVHRDFKPENVIVGADGRVRVMDFGLARLRPSDGTVEAADAGSPMRVESKSPLSDQLTIAGTVVGTPAYMAPEIFQGKGADARTDQFSFGVALYEALYRARPYDKQDLHPPVAGLRAHPPADSDVPAQIRRVVLRAISIDHDQRYPSIDAMLAELELDPLVNRKRVAFGAVAVLALAGVAGGAFALRSDGEAICGGANDRIASIWHPAAKATIRAAFGATKLPHAWSAYRGLERALDAYATEWMKVSSESCTATRVHGAQTEEVMSLRQACLDQRYAELRAFIALAHETNPALVEKGERAVTELEPLSRCSDIEALREPGKPRPEHRDRILALHLHSAEAKAQAIGGRWIQALVAAQKLLDGATEIGWAQQIGEAQAVRGAALLSTGNFDEAVHAFGEATWAGMAARRDDLVITGALATAMTVASGQGKPGEAKVWFSIADAAIKRRDYRKSIDQAVQLRRHQVHGIVLVELGDVLGAAKAHREAFEWAQQMLGKDSPLLYADEATLATTLQRAFLFRQSAHHFESALARRESIVGPDHPDIAVILSNMGTSYRRLYQHDRAHAALDRALALREKAYGKNSPLLVPTLDNLADLYRQEGNLPRALESIERAFRFATVLPGKTHPAWHQVATDYAEVLLVAERRAEVRKLLDEVLQLEQSQRSAVLPHTQTIYAELARSERKWQEAATFAALAVSGYEAQGGVEHPELYRPLMNLGLAKLELGDADAKAQLERAIAIGDKTELAPQYLAPAREALGRLAR